MHDVTKIAHAGEDHGDGTANDHEATTYTEQPSQPATPTPAGEPAWFTELQLSGVVLFGVVVLFLVLKRCGVSQAVRLGVALAVLLLIGLILYRWTPVLSTLALIIGFGLAFFSAFGQLSKR